MSSWAGSGRFLGYFCPPALTLEGSLARADKVHSNYRAEPLQRQGKVFKLLKSFFGCSIASNLLINDEINQSTSQAAKKFSANE
jgi:hypothetical protein